MKTLYLKSGINKDYDKAAEILKNGGLVAIPTETVYGLAANALNSESVKNIFAAKGRPGDNPLIVHISSMEELYPLVEEVPEKAKILAEKFWPGPLTMIFKKSSIIPDEVSAGLETVAVRMPSHKDAREIIKRSGIPLAAPSANTSGRPSPTNAKRVLEDMDGKIDAVFDGGNCEYGVESTVITLVGDVPTLLRPGGITYTQLCDALGEVNIDKGVLSPVDNNRKVASPGMKYKHYAPKAHVTIIKGSFEGFKNYVEQNAKEGCAVMCFEGEEKYFSLPCVTYGTEKDHLSQSKRIFEALRETDSLGAQRVYARCPSTDEIGLAVLNRLLRAAAFEVIEVE